MSESKAEFWWASICGADPEPVEKTKHDGRPCVYTIGCADPFYLDGEHPAAQLIACARDGQWVFVDKLPSWDRFPINRPKHPDVSAAERAAREVNREREYTALTKGRKTFVRTDGVRVPAVHHGWRGPR